MHNRAPNAGSFKPVSIQSDGLGPTRSQNPARALPTVAGAYSQGPRRSVLKPCRLVAWSVQVNVVGRATSGTLKLYPRHEPLSKIAGSTGLVHSSVPGRPPGPLLA